MTTTEAQRLKSEGQAASLFTLAIVHHLNFEAIVRSAPARFSINDIREACDRMLIPDGARGALFNAALRAGLIARKMTSDGYPARIPSSGTSAHSAYVQVYERVTS